MDGWMNRKNIYEKVDGWSDKIYEKKIDGWLDG